LKKKTTNNQGAGARKPRPQVGGGGATQNPRGGPPKNGCLWGFCFFGLAYSWFSPFLFFSRGGGGGLGNNPTQGGAGGNRFISRGTLSGFGKGREKKPVFHVTTGGGLGGQSERGKQGGNSPTPTIAKKPRFSGGKKQTCLFSKVCIGPPCPQSTIGHT